MNQINDQWTGFQHQLKGFVLKRVKDKSAADDIVQDVYVKIYNKSHQLQDQEKLVGWIYQITRNTIADYYRKSNQVLQFEYVDAHQDVTDFNACVEDCMQKIVETLPDKYRMALQLAEFESLSQIEVAQKLGISYSGAKSRVQRARQMLRQKIDEQLIIETDGYGNVIVCEDRSPCDCR